MKFIKNKYNNEMCDILLHEKVASITDWNKTDNVLILGAGRGVFENRIRNKVKSITSIDIDSNNWIGTNKFIKLDLNNKLWFKDNIKFDKIIAVEIIEHINDTNNFLENIKRLSKPNTIIIISTPNINSIMSRVYFMINGYLLHFGEGCLKYGHVNPIFKHIFKHQLFKLDFKIQKESFNRLESKYIIYNNLKDIFRKATILIISSVLKIFVKNKIDIDKSIIIYKLKINFKKGAI